MNDRLKYLHADLQRINDALSYFDSKKIIMESQKRSLNKHDIEYYETLKKEKNLVESEIAKIN